MKLLAPFLMAAALAGCAAYDGRGLKPGEARLEDVLRVMGAPAQRRQAADGGLRLFYPRGPSGTASYLVELDAAGRLTRIENVLDIAHFARIRPGMSQDEVLGILGPPEPGWTVYFAARDELAWEWRYCDAWNHTARFNVLFDGTSGLVRSTLSLTESQRRMCVDGDCLCSH